MKTLKGSSLAVTGLPEWKQEHGTSHTWKPHLPSVNLPKSLMPISAGVWREPSIYQEQRRHADGSLCGMVPLSSLLYDKNLAKRFCSTSCDCPEPCLVLGLSFLGLVVQDWFYRCFIISPHLIKGLILNMYSHSRVYICM